MEELWDTTNFRSCTDPEGLFTSRLVRVDLQFLQDAENIDVTKWLAARLNNSCIDYLFHEFCNRN